MDTAGPFRVGSGLVLYMLLGMVDVVQLLLLLPLDDDQSCI